MFFRNLNLTPAQVIQAPNSTASSFGFTSNTSSWSPQVILVTVFGVLAVVAGVPGAALAIQTIYQRRG